MDSVSEKTLRVVRKEVNKEKKKEAQIWPTRKAHKKQLKGKNLTIIDDEFINVNLGKYTNKHINDCCFKIKISTDMEARV